MGEELSVFKFLKFEQKKSNNKCGTPLIKVMHEFDFDLQKTKDILTTLYKQKKINIREGINHKLIFLKN